MNDDNHRLKKTAAIDKFFISELKFHKPLISLVYIHTFDIKHSKTLNTFSNCIDFAENS